jgi:hypothetical protein
MSYPSSPIGPMSCISVTIPVVVGETTVQTMVNNTIRFTESVIKVESIDAHVLSTEVDIVDGKVIIRGKIRKQILYVTHSHYVKEKREDVSFTTFAVIPGATPDDKASAEVKIHGVDWSLEQHARLEQHILLDITVTVTRNIDVNIPVWGAVTGQVMLGGVAQANAILALFDSNGVLSGFTVTNANGYYKFSNIAVGAYTIIAAVIGSYEAKTIQVGPDCLTPLVVNFFNAPTSTCTNTLSSATCNLVAGLLNLL